MDTFDSGVCNGAPFTDPDGNRLQLHRRYAPLEPSSRRPGRRANGLRRHQREGPWRARRVLRRDARPQAESARERRVAGVRGGERRPRAEHAGAEGRRRLPARVRRRAPRCRRAASMERLQAAASSSSSRSRTTRASATWRSSRTPTATALMLHHRYAPYTDGTQP